MCRHLKKRTSIVCLTCKKEFLVLPHDLREREPKYCSRDCMNLGFKGKDFLIAVGKNRDGKNNPCWRGGISVDKEYQLMNHRKNRSERLGKDVLSIETIKLVYEDNIKKYGTLTCYLCLKSIEFGKDCLEHKVPLSRGGTSLYENLGIAHRGCNSRKGRRTEEEYKNKLGGF